MIVGENKRFNVRYPHIEINPDLVAICDECYHEFMIYRCKLQSFKNANRHETGQVVHITRSNTRQNFWEAYSRCL